MEKCQKPNYYENDLDPLETVDFLNICKEITGEDNICIKDVDYSSKDIYEINKQNTNLHHMLYKAIMASLINPELITALYLLFLRCKNFNFLYKLYYNSNGDIEYMNIYYPTNNILTSSNIV